MAPPDSSFVPDTFLPNNAYVSTHYFPRGRGPVAGGAQRKRKASRNTETILREKVPLSTIFENSINNHSKCNNARTPGTQARPSGVTSNQGLAGQRRE